MPTYQYACTECGDRSEVVQRFSDDPLTVCTVCGGKLRKVFSPVGIVFKGSGFYRTDSRDGSGTAGAKKEPVNGSSAASSESGNGSSSDSGGASSTSSSESSSADKKSSASGDKKPSSVSAAAS